MKEPTGELQKQLKNALGRERAALSDNRMLRKLVALQGEQLLAAKADLDQLRGTNQSADGGYIIPEPFGSWVAAWMSTWTAGEHNLDLHTWRRREEAAGHDIDQPYVTDEKRQG